MPAVLVKERGTEKGGLVVLPGGLVPDLELRTSNGERTEEQLRLDLRVGAAGVAQYATRLKGTPVERHPGLQPEYGHNMDRLLEWADFFFRALDTLERLGGRSTSYGGVRQESVAGAYRG